MLWIRIQSTTFTVTGERVKAQATDALYVYVNVNNTTHCLISLSKSYLSQFTSPQE
jgi:hypothetical protein